MKLFIELRKEIKEAKKIMAETKKTDPEKWLENYRKWKELEAQLRQQQAVILRQEAKAKTRKLKDHYKFFLGGLAVRYIFNSKENYETVEKNTAEMRVRFAGILLNSFLSTHPNITDKEIEDLCNAQQS